MSPTPSGTVEGPDPHAGEATVTAGAPALAADAALVLLHGRGATAQGIVNLTASLRRHGLAVLAPQAARSRWYPYGADEPLDRNEPHLSSALRRVEAALDAAADVGVPPERTVLLGFSQGASVVAEFAAARPRRYGGVVVLSGGLLGPDAGARSFAGSLDGTPALVAAGDGDERMSVSRLQATAGAFARLGADVTEHVHEGIGHEVRDEDLAFAGGLLDGVLASA
jgi:phospholipase/carboxylesterase